MQQWSRCAHAADQSSGSHIDDPRGAGNEPKNEKKQHDRCHDFDDDDHDHTQLAVDGCGFNVAASFSDLQTATRRQTEFSSSTISVELTSLHQVRPHFLLIYSA
jgi:hypothetical protein